jgi:hypothetical protein
VKINLAQSAIAARFGACEHAIEAFEGVDVARQGLRHYILHAKARLLEEALKFVPGRAVAVHPSYREANYRCRATDGFKPFGDPLNRVAENYSQ